MGRGEGRRGEGKKKWGVGGREEKRIGKGSSWR